MLSPEILIVDDTSLNLDVLASLLSAYACGSRPMARPHFAWLSKNLPT